MDVRLGVLASGRGSNFVSLVEACRSGQVDAEPVILISDNADAQALRKAEQRGVPSHFVPYDEFDRSHFEDHAASLLKEYGCDLVALAGFMRVLTADFLEDFPERVLNIHPSLLPAFRGLNAQAQALEYGVKVTGCTVHVVTEEVDAGPIVDQIAVRVHEDDTEKTLSKRILEQEHRLYPRALQHYIETRLPDLTSVQAP